MSENERGGTTQGTLRVRQRRSMAAQEKMAEAQVEWVTPKKKRAGDSLWKNLAVASSLVLCAVALRTGAIPPLTSTADVVMTAATDDSLLDEPLGRLSFVSALFPEATLVFGESSDTLALPVSSGAAVVHAWSAAEPYMAWSSASGQVSAAAPGEVLGVYHGNGEERMVQVLSDSGLSCVYGNLSTVSVQAGDLVATGDALGQLLPDAPCVLEVRRDGVSIDPAVLLRTP